MTLNFIFLSNALVFLVTAAALVFRPEDLMRGLATVDVELGVAGVVLARFAALGCVLGALVAGMPVYYESWRTRRVALLVLLVTWLVTMLMALLIPVPDFQPLRTLTWIVAGSFAVLYLAIQVRYRGEITRIPRDLRKAVAESRKAAPAVAPPDASATKS